MVKPIRHPKETKRVGVILCSICGKWGGTLTRVGEKRANHYYAHRHCIENQAFQRLAKAGTHEPEPRPNQEPVEGNH